MLGAGRRMVEGGDFQGVGTKRRTNEGNPPFPPTPVRARFQVAAVSLPWTVAHFRWVDNGQRNRQVLLRACFLSQTFIPLLHLFPQRMGK